MPKSIDDLNNVLEEILKVMQGTAKAQGTGGNSSSNTAPGGKTLKDHFADAFKKGAKDGFGFEKMLGGQAGKLGSLAGQGYGAAGMAGAIGAPLLAVGVEMAKLPGQIREFAQELHNANRQFAQFSPSMAMVMAMSDMRDNFRKMDQGEKLAASAERLAEARGNLEDQLAPIETEWQKLKNNVGAGLAEGMSTFLEKSEWGKQLADIMKNLNEIVGGEEPTPLRGRGSGNWEDQLTAIVKDEERKRTERMQRSRPAPIRPPRDPRPNFAHDPDRRGGGDF